MSENGYDKYGQKNGTCQKRVPFLIINTIRDFFGSNLASPNKLREGEGESLHLVLLLECQLLQNEDMAIKLICNIFPSNYFCSLCSW